MTDLDDVARLRTLDDVARLRALDAGDMLGAVRLPTNSSWFSGGLLKLL